MTQLKVGDIAPQFTGVNQMVIQFRCLIFGARK